jgi:hypothetical protein
MPTNINLGDVDRIAKRHPIWEFRGKAINAYSNLEQALCALFSLAASIQMDVAGIIFFRITSTRYRNLIVDKLIRKRFGKAYNLFLNSYFKQLDGLDRRRNEIIHWTTAASIGGVDKHGRPVVDVSLIAPNLWDHTTRSQPITVNDMVDFIEKCVFCERAVNMFHVFLDRQLHDNKEQEAAWRDIFQQPLIYPPPETHPLSPNYKGPKSQPPPSQA